MFRRSSQDAPTDAVPLEKTSQTGEDAAKARPAEAPKGRPTPKRSEAEASRRGRAYATKDPKEAKRSARDSARTDRERQMLAMRGQGDPRDLPPRDKGPVRRFARDFVDSRWTAFEFFLPVLLVILVLSVTRNSTLVYVSVLLWPLSMIIIVLQTTFLGFRLKRELAQRFPNENTKGAVAYAIMRSMQMRRLRLPKPMVKRGQKP